MKPTLKSRIVEILLLSAATTLAADPSAPALIPVPQRLERREGAFELGPETRIVVDAVSRDAGRYLADRLRKSTGYPLLIETGCEPAEVKGATRLIRPAVPAERSGDIRLTTQSANPRLGPEGYQLAVAAESVVVRAPRGAGLFYGVQSLRQLLPPEVFAPKPVSGVTWQMPCLQLEDQPRFKWRGLMLDVSRHFFNKDEVKQLLDAMALHKLNTFHWHLVDDHGWRVEIKKYPRLTEVGAWRQDIGFNLDPKASMAYGPDGRYGGFYTQADIREVVAYAKARHITVVPEIEMPGHSLAALAAYPGLGCTGGPYTLELKGGVFKGVYCAGKEETFVFLQDVLTEVSRLFPGPYLHIGGDEVPKDNWQKCPLCQARMKQEGLKTEHELQSYFIRRIEKIVNARGRRLIGWSEIREGGLAQNAAIMDWKGGGREAAREGHDVVMSPTRFCYLDYYQSTNRAAEPRAIGNFLPLDRAYSFEPIPAGLEPQYEKHILGGQGNLWTEYIPSLSHAQYMIFPRACALAEALWSPQTARNWEDFQRRLQVHNQRLDQLGVRYRRDLPDPAALNRH